MMIQLQRIQLAKWNEIEKEPGRGRTSGGGSVRHRLAVKEFLRLGCNNPRWFWCFRHTGSRPQTDVHLHVGAGELQLLLCQRVALERTRFGRRHRRPLAVLQRLEHCLVVAMETRQLCTVARSTAHDNAIIAPLSHYSQFLQILPDSSELPGFFFMSSLEILSDLYRFWWDQIQLDSQHHSGSFFFSFFLFFFF